jgi:hypothetical protein
MNVEKNINNLIPAAQQVFMLVRKISWFKKVRKLKPQWKYKAVEPT